MPLTETQIAEGLVDPATTPAGVTNPTPQDRQRAALVNAGTWLMRRQATQFYFNVTVTVIGGLIGAATLLLLYEQNQKIEFQTMTLEEQNGKIRLQTDASIMESALLESSRRAQFSDRTDVLIKDIQEAVRTTTTCKIEDSYLLREDDCWRGDRDTPGSIFKPPNELRERIEAFAIANPPYRVPVQLNQHLDFDLPLRKQFRLYNASPERGRILRAMAQLRLPVNDYDFSGAQVSAANLSERRLNDADLRYADFAKAYLEKTNFILSQLDDANFASATLIDADLRKSSAVGTDFSSSRAWNAKFDEANLSRTIFADAKLDAAQFRDTNLTNAVFSAAFLIRADFSNSNLTSTVFNTATLAEANFSGANLTDTDFTAAKFSAVLTVNRIVYREPV